MFRLLNAGSVKPGEAHYYCLQGKTFLIYYDGEKGQITNLPAANQYLQREYRKGWSL